MKRSTLRFLLSPDPAEGNGTPQTAEQINTPQTGKVEIYGVNGPQSAEIVLGAEVTEETVRLKRDLETTAAEKKRVEMRAAELEDENRRLKSIGLKPEPAKVEDKRSALERFMAGEDV